MPDATLEKALSILRGAAGGGIEDMIQLETLSAESILENLRLRYKNDAIYTYTGSILVATNPYQLLPIYDNAVANAYNNKRIGELPPHIFAIGDVAYRDMLDFRRNQSIIISGESGSGKTETTKLLLQYLSSLTASHSVVEQRILESSPILESFGNAKTVWNDNSSRFGKFINVTFDESGFINGAYITSYLLEKSRIIQPNKNERNYHVFYVLLAADEEIKEVLKLGDQNSYRYLTGNGAVFDRGVDESEEFERLQQALDFLAIDEDNQTSLWKVVSSVLNIGNIEFTPQGDKVSIANMALVNDIAELLQVDAKVLVNALTTRKITAGGQVTVIPLKPEQANETRDSFAKMVYASSFDWLVEHINKSISVEEGAAAATEDGGDAPKKTSAYQIGVLDIFGFENFEHNGFEQLTINWTNEKLQQLFTSAIFKIEQQEYERDGITWDKVSFNDNEQTLALIEKNLGIMSILDEETRFPKATDNTFLEKVLQNHAKHPSIRINKQAKNSLGIAHYAGEVQYDVIGFLDKNRDALPAEFVDLVRSSQDAFVAGLFESRGDAGNSGTERKKKLNTIAGKFKRQLNELIETLSATETHYVRCVKPNSQKVPSVFEDALVEAQLRYGGMLETIRIRKNGYPVRQPHATFYRRYSVAPMCTAATAPVQFDTSSEADMKSACEWILSLVPSEQAANYQVGNTKVFLRDSLLAMLEQQRNAGLDVSAALIQAFWRSRVQRRKYVATRRAVVLAQSLVRARAERRRYQRTRYVMTRVQATYKARLTQRHYQRQRDAALVLQSMARGYAEREHFKKQRALAVLLQALARGYIARRDYILSKDAKAREEAARREAEKKRLEAEAAAEAARLEAERKAAEEAAAAEKAKKDADALEEAKRLEKLAAQKERNKKRMTFAPVGEINFDREKEKAELAKLGNSTLTRENIEQLQMSLLAGGGDDMEMDLTTSAGGEAAPTNAKLERTQEELRKLTPATQKPTAGADAKAQLSELAADDFDTLNFISKEMVQQRTARFREAREAQEPKLLPQLAKLVDDIEKSAKCMWPLGAFAERHFQPVIKGTFRKKSKGGDDLLKWSKKGLKAPLLKDMNLDKSAFDMAMEAQKEIVAFCDSSQPDLTALQSFLTKGLVTRGPLSIELFCQLIRHGADNPSELSTKRSWQMMAAACAHFLPRPDEFVPPLFNHFIMAKRAKSPSWLAPLATQCVENLLHTFVYLDRPQVASKIELEHIMENQPMNVQIWSLAPGIDPIDVKCRPWTTVGAVWFDVVDKFGLLDPIDYAIYEVFNNLERSLDVRFRLTDSFGMEERYAQQLAATAAKEGKAAPKLKFRLVCKRKVFYRPRDVVREDLVANRFAYFQALQSVMGGDLPVQSEQAYRLGGIHLHVREGDASKSVLSLDEEKMRTVMTSVLPARQLDKVMKAGALKVKEALDTVMREWKRLEGTDRGNDSFLRYVATAARSPLYGSTIVECRHEMGSLQVPSSFKLFINIRGVFFVAPDTGGVVQEFGWSRVRDCLFNVSTVKIFFENDEGDVSYFVFMTVKAAEVSSVMDAYMSFLRAQSMTARARLDIPEQPPDAKGRPLLSYHTGDMLKIVERTEPHWWLCELDGRRGMVNAAHVEVLIVDSEAKAARGRSTGMTLRGGAVTIRGGDAGSAIEEDPQMIQALKRIEARRAAPSQFPLMAWAMRFFRSDDNDREPLLGTLTPQQMEARQRAVSARAAFTVKPLGASLLRVLGSHESALAADAFKSVLHYMGDDTEAVLKMVNTGAKETPAEAMAGVNERSTPSQVAAVQKLCSMGIAEPKLRDELFLQVCKQIMGNPRLSSTERGWRLMAILLRTILPSNEFMPFLAVFLQNDEPQPQHKTFERRIKRLSRFAQVCLHYAALQRRCAPPRDEIAELERQSLRPISVTVGTPDSAIHRVGTAAANAGIALEARATTRVAEASGALVLEYPPARTLGMSVCENIGGLEGEVMLSADDLLVDAISHWEAANEESERAQPPLVMRRKIVLDQSTKVPDDEASLNALFLQTIEDVHSGRLVPKVENVGQVLAWIVRGLHGMRHPDIDEDPTELDWSKAITYRAVKAFTPSSWLPKDKTYDDWRADAVFEAKQAGMQNLDIVEARRLLLEWAAQHPMYGASWFLCKKTQRLTKATTEYPVAMSVKGIFVFKMGKPQAEKTYKYAEFRNWSAESGRFSLVGGSLAKDFKLVFETRRALEMCDMFGMYKRLADNESMKGKRANPKRQSSHITIAVNPKPTETADAKSGATEHYGVAPAHVSSKSEVSTSEV